MGLKVPCGVTVAQQILDLLVMVRIHARQPLFPAIAGRKGETGDLKPEGVFTGILFPLLSYPFFLTGLE